MKDHLIGPVFKELRRDKNMTMTEVGHGIVTKSFLSRFESGETDISAEHMFELLNRINVNIDELLVRTDISDKTNFHSWMLEIAEKYYQEDVLALQKMESEQVELAEKSDTKYNKINAIIIRGLITDLLPDASINTEDSRYIADYLFSIEDWTTYEVELFSSTLHLLLPEIVEVLITELIQNTTRNMALVAGQKLVASTILNAIVNRIEASDLARAAKYYGVLDTIKLPISMVFLKIQKRYLLGLIIYLQGDNHGLDEALEMVGILEKLGYNDQAKQHKQFIDQMVES